MLDFDGDGLSHWLVALLFVFDLDVDFLKRARSCNEDDDALDDEDAGTIKCAVDENEVVESLGCVVEVDDTVVDDEDVGSIDGAVEDNESVELFGYVVAVDDI